MRILRDANRVRTEDAIAAVKQIIEEDPNESIRQCAIWTIGAVLIHFMVDLDPTLCALWAKRITGSYFFKNQWDYRAMDNDFFALSTVPTRQRYMPYSQRNNQFIEGNFW